MKAKPKSLTAHKGALFGRRPRKYGFTPNGIFGLFKIGKDRANVGTRKLTVRKARLFALGAYRRNEQRAKNVQG